MKHFFLYLMMLTGLGLSDSPKHQIGTRRKIYPSDFQPQDIHPIRTLIIDAGHGGKDPGALGHGSKEKDITLKIALELKRIVNENLPNIKVVMTRSTDKFVELKKRGEIALNNKGDFFVSIHCNSVPKNVTSPSGACIYILGYNKGQERYISAVRENEVIQFEDNYEEQYGGYHPNTPEGEIFHNLMKNAFRKESMNLAGKIDKQIKERVGRKTFGVKQAPFIVLWSSGVPAVLIETGYISHKNESSFLATTDGQVLLASAIYRSIKEYNAELAK